MRFHGNDSALWNMNSGYSCAGALQVLPGISTRVLMMREWRRGLHNL